MNWTQLEREGYKPKDSMFDDGFPHVPTERPMTAMEIAEAFASIVMLIVGLTAFYLAIKGMGI